MKSYGMNMKGDLSIENVNGLPSWTSADESRVVYDTSSNKMYIGNNIGWVDTAESLGFTPENVANKTNTTLDTSTTKYPTNRLVKEYTDGLVTGLLDYRGSYNASGNVYPSSGGSGPGGAVAKGDTWYIGTGGTLNGQAIQTGDSIHALIDNPPVNGWNRLQGNITYVPENSSNKRTSVSGSSTNTQYPSAKLFYDKVIGLGTSRGLNGYQKLGNGLIINWGHTTKSATGYNNVIYPIAFPTACLSFISSEAGYVTGHIDGTVCWGYSMSRTYGRIFMGASNPSVIIEWSANYIAIGY
jgi:hypothetical protein